MNTPGRMGCLATSRSPSQVCCTVERGDASAWPSARPRARSASGSTADSRDTPAATKNAAVMSASATTLANSSGPAMAAPFCDAVSVEAARIRCRSGMTMGTSAERAGLASICENAVQAIPT